MSKGSEALNHIVVDDYKKDLLIIEKKLEALDIIMKKNVDVGAVKNCVDDYAYNDSKGLSETTLIKRKELTKQEFDLLKEVLL